MYTRCPECLTTFSITQEQLSERSGMVRCGHCDKVFYAEETLGLDWESAQRSPPPQPAIAEPETESKKEYFFRHSVALRESNFVKTTTEELAAIKAKLLGRNKGHRTRPVFWLAGTILMSLLLATQYVYFHRDTLALHTTWGPYVVKACDMFHCVIHPQQDVGLIELVDTAVTPHPKYQHALQVRATMINRARYGQAFPLMEISLTNRQGETNGRRTYSPTEYLKQKDISAKLMPKNVAIKALLDIANPEKDTEGYEIRLVSY